MYFAVDFERLFQLQIHINLFCNFSVYIAGRNDIRGDCGLGHLTFKGYKQQIVNGENLRKAYVDTGFLSSNYNVHEDFLRTDGKLCSFYRMQFALNHALLLAIS